MLAASCRNWQARHWFVVVDMASVVGQARVILGVVRGACSSIVCDLMLLIEGCTQDELPERMLGGARWFPSFSFSLFLFLPLS